MAIHSNASDLEVRRVPITSIVPNPANARQHSARDLEVIAASLARFGQRQAIAVDMTQTPPMIRAGEGRWLAMQQLGWTHCYIAPWTPATPEDAVAYGLVDNRSAELSQWDYGRTAEQLKALQSSGEDLARLGWQPQEAEPLLRADFAPPPLEHIEFDAAARVPMGKPLALSVEQWQTVGAAIARLRAREHDDTLLEGRAIELICMDYLAGPGNG